MTNALYIQLFHTHTTWKIAPTHLCTSCHIHNVDTTQKTRSLYGLAWMTAAITDIQDHYGQNLKSSTCLPKRFNHGGRSKKVEKLNLNKL